MLTGNLSKRDRIAVIGAYFVLLTAAAFVLLMLVWMLAPVEVVVVKEFRVLDQAVRPGQTLAYFLSYCKLDRYADRQALVQYSYINHLVHTVPIEWSTLASGCHEITQILVVPQLPPDVYRLEMERVYRVNPLKTFRLVKLSNAFEVKHQQQPMPAPTNVPVVPPK